jgi:hypothetical protein
MNWHRAVLIVVIVLPPLEPEWMGNLSSRENYKRLVVQTIYRVQGLERVVEAGECSCATRFPPWDTAVQHFNDRYLGADRNAMREAEDRYLTRFNQLRLAAREICEADGNW